MATVGPWHSGDPASFCSSLQNLRSNGRPHGRGQRSSIEEENGPQYQSKKKQAQCRGNRGERKNAYRKIARVCVQLQADCRAADLQVAGADGIPRNHQCMGKPPVVVSGNGLEEEIRVTTCRPCLALIVGASLSWLAQAALHVWKNVLASRPSAPPSSTAKGRTLWGRTSPNISCLLPSAASAAMSGKAAAAAT